MTEHKYVLVQHNWWGDTVVEMMNELLKDGWYATMAIEAKNGKVILMERYAPVATIDDEVVIHEQSDDEPEPEQEQRKSRFF